MAEYIERGAALRVAHIMRPEDKRLETEMGQIPTADVAPVVRCKDCQFWQRHTQVNRDCGRCERFGTVTTTCDDFCSLGVKKSDE